MEKIIKINDQKDLPKINYYIRNFSKNNTILLDGSMGSGKTNLFGPYISTNHKFELINLDNFIVKNTKGTYELDNFAVFEKYKVSLNIKERVILEGIMIKDCLKYLNLNDYTWVYIQVMQNNIWKEREFLDFDYISEYYGENYTPTVGGPIDEQLFYYHKEYNPIKNTDLLIQIEDDLLNHIVKNLDTKVNN
jgi:hypothetical protein